MDSAVAAGTHGLLGKRALADSVPARASNKMKLPAIGKKPAAGSPFNRSLAKKTVAEDLLSPVSK